VRELQRANVARHGAWSFGVGHRLRSGNVDNIFGYFNSLSKPFWYTPGDNDWTDCHRNNNGALNPLER
jgi:hypothetical protein